MLAIPLLLWLGSCLAAGPASIEVAHPHGGAPYRGPGDIVPPQANEPALELSSLFGTGMVLQCDEPVTIFGQAAPGQTVRVSLFDRSPEGGAASHGRTEADAEGAWQVPLSAREAGGPYEITVRTEDAVATVGDVWFGEVWICSGQSNMQWALSATNEAQHAIARATHPNIRLFTVPRKPQDEPSRELIGEWVPCTPEDAAKFSAVAYYFGRLLQANLKRPIGLIHTSWGGTPAEAWTERSFLEAEPGFAPILNRAPDATNRFHRPSWQPSALYNGMIAPLVPYTIRGAIWYQGESNADRAFQYRKLFPAMIQSWREAFGQGDFPFLYVQLANFKAAREEPGESDWAELREAQAMTLALPNTAMAVTIDIGEARDIHPRNKREVGERLALAALHTAYGQIRTHSGPVFRAMQIEDDKLRLSFDHLGGGLIVKGGGSLRGFAVAGSDRVFHWAKARIEKNQVVLECAAVTEPVAVRYGWADNPGCNLANREGLPASPFRTDNWPGLTVERR